MVTIFEYRQKFGPLIPGIHVTPFPYEYHGITSEMAMTELDQLFKDTLHEDDVAAFLIEPVLGEGKLLFLTNANVNISPTFDTQQQQEDTSQHHPTFSKKSNNSPIPKTPYS